MVNGMQVKRKDKACLFTPIKTSTRGIGLMEKNMAKELTFLMQLE
jgi:hypothetical protein